MSIVEAMNTNKAQYMHITIHFVDLYKYNNHHYHYNYHHDYCLHDYYLHDYYLHDYYYYHHHDNDHPHYYRKAANPKSVYLLRLE